MISDRLPKRRSPPRSSELAPLEAFAARHADLAVNLNGELENIKFGAKPDPVALANLWTANNDARGYVIIGDPAVRLAR